MSKKITKIYPHKKNNRFYLHKNHRPESFLFGTVPSFFNSLIFRRKNCFDGIHEWVDLQQPQSCSIEPVITWMGHATFLVQLGGINIITDPIFGHSSRFFPRMLPLGITVDRLPNIDIVLLSHNHRDHMDAPSLYALKNNNTIRYLVPQGDKRWFDRRGFERVAEHMWWDQVTVKGSDNNQEIRCTFLPAIHWSQRGLFDKNKSLWGSWMIEWKNFCIYFAGDTAYGDHFSCIAHEFPSIDVTLMPIGPCEPRDWMKHSHMSPQEAGNAFCDLDATHFVPMHWGTFGFGVDDFITPINQLQLWWDQQQSIAQQKRLHLVKVGKPRSF